jgi:hypothetical protein
MDKAPLIIGDEVIKYSSSNTKAKEPEEVKNGGQFNFELVTGDNVSPAVKLENFASKGESDGDIEDLAKDSVYVNSRKTVEENKVNEEKGFFELMMLNPIVDLVIIDKDEYN